MLLLTDVICNSIRKLIYSTLLDFLKHFLWYTVDIFEVRPMAYCGEEGYLTFKGGNSRIIINYYDEENKELLKLDERWE